MLPRSLSLLVVIIVTTRAASAFDFAEPDAVVVGQRVGSGSARRLAVADVNGDGIADLVNGASQRDLPGHAYVSFGPLSGTVVAGDDVTITPTSRDGFAETLTAGDADGDGFGDVLIGAIDRAEDPALVHLLLGPISGEVSTSEADLVLHRGPREHFSWEMHIAPDVDGDGRNDLVIAAPDTGAPDSHVGAVYVVGGGTTGSRNPESVATYTFRGTPEEGALGTSAIALDDTDGDGIDDLAMTDWQLAYVVPGGIAGGDYEPGAVAMATFYMGDTWVEHLASVDHDRDGYGDLLIGDPDHDADGSAAVVYLFAGPLAGVIDAEADAAATWQGDGVGMSIAIGDGNGDGEPDYLLGALGPRLFERGTGHGGRGSELIAVDSATVRWVSTPVRARLERRRRGRDRGGRALVRRGLRRRVRLLLGVAIRKSSREGSSRVSLTARVARAARTISGRNRVRA